MLLTTGHTSQGCGWWVATSTTPVGARPVTCKKHFDEIFIWFPRIVWPRSGYIIYFEGRYEERMFGDGRPNGLNIVISFVLLSYPPTLSWLLHGYCCMGAPLTACLVK